MKHDFGFGDTRGIRKIMCRHLLGTVKESYDLASCGYPPHEGDDDLILQIRLLIRDLTGRTYKNVLITNGATNAINAYLYAVRSEYKPYMITDKLYFSFYPGIAKTHNLIHKTKQGFGEPGITIVDSPSNPLGKLRGLEDLGRYKKDVLWDAAYHSPTYCGYMDGNKLKCHPTMPAHDAMAGSLNKLTGLNGLRVGWLATDSDEIYSKALDYVTNDLCGVSGPSQWIANEILTKVDLDRFYIQSRALLDYNREEVAKLSNLFGNQGIPGMGMFALFEVDEKLKALLLKAEVKTLPGSIIGDDRDSVRFNLANDMMATRNMVKDILKADRK